MKFGSKRAIFGVIFFFFRGLDLVWESATPTTHIWERSPKKKRFFFGSFPKSNLTLSDHQHVGGTSGQDPDYNGTFCC